MFDFFRLVPKKRSVKIKSKSGVIFSNPSGNKKYLFYLGTFVFCFAIGYFCYLYWPLAKSIIVYKSGGRFFSKTEIKQDEIEQKIVKEEFWVKIPIIGASAEVKKDISPFDKNKYLPVLEKDFVAQARGSGLPGSQDKAIYLFAHSSKEGVRMVRNNSVFYLLGELKNNDYIFIGYNGEIYKYKVYDQKIVGANDVDYLDYKEEGKEILILQTCWPIGTDWKRLLVFAERI
jgi:LPXTG-site transpeptidase (sortase) family protein